MDFVFIKAYSPEDELRSLNVDVDAFATSTACCDLDL